MSEYAPSCSASDEDRWSPSVGPVLAALAYSMKPIFPEGPWKRYGDPVVSVRARWAASST